MNAHVVIREIGHSFGKKKVLENVSLSLGQGEIFGLLGPSGAGKTTLIKILTGQLVPTSGEARIFGEDCRRLSKEAYKGIGMMLDNAGLYERLSCYDNLKLFTRIYGIGADRITQVLEEVGLAEAKKRPVMKLSKGMRSRLVLARAIMHEPGLLFLDEPTSGLDPATAAQVHGLIMRQKERGATVFLTTHNMEEAAKLCDHVALLHEGSIVEYGKPDEICRKYNHKNSIRILLKNGEAISLVNDSSSAEKIAAYMTAEEVESIHSTEPNLETVFMELTGRGLV